MPGHHTFPLCLGTNLRVYNYGTHTGLFSLAQALTAYRVAPGKISCNSPSAAWDCLSMTIVSTVMPSRSSSSRKDIKWSVSILNSFPGSQTKVPLPWIRLIIPWLDNSLSACRTVPRETPNSAAISSSLGNLVPTGYTPRSIPEQWKPLFVYTPECHWLSINYIPHSTDMITCIYHILAFCSRLAGAVNLKGESIQFVIQVGVMGKLQQLLAEAVGCDFR